MRRFLTLEAYTLPFYAAVTAFERALLTVFTGWKVTGRENVPPRGVIVVSNHLNHGDPPIMCGAIPMRRIRYMAKEELFRGRLSFFIRIWGAFPVRRFDADMRALITAERLLRDGHAVGMFPEGTRSRDGHIGRFHPGTALIALRTGAPVLPCAIAGTEQLTTWRIIYRRPRITIRIGKPIPVESVRRPTEEQIAALTAEIRAAIQALLPAKYGGTYTGREGIAAHGRSHPGK